YAYNAGVSNLTGLEAAVRLRFADLGSNGVSDLAPLSKLDALRDLNLNDNVVADVSPLLGMDAIQNVFLSGNPLTEASLNDHIPDLRKEGVEVHVESVAWELLAGGETARFEVEGYLESLLGSVLRTETVGDDPGLATVQMVEGALEISPHGAYGVLNVMVTATGRTGNRATLSFIVRLLALPDRELGLGSGPLTIDLDEALGGQVVSSTYEAVSSDDTVAAVRIEGGSLFVEPRADGTVTVTVTAMAGDGTGTAHSFDMRVVSRSREVDYLLPAGDERRQGFVRAINHSAEPGELSIEAFDAAGTAYGPLTMSIPANGTLHFTSEDLERGNAGAGLPDGVGVGQGGWRLVLDSERDIEVLSYVRTADGFLTAMHDVAPEDENGVYRVAIFNPGSDTDRVSMLRLVNAAEVDATVTIRGIDEDGMSPGSDVQVSVPAGQARNFSAADLEAGTGVTGALGDGAGKWRLVVSSNAAIRVMSLLESPGGYLTNLSPVPKAHGDTWTVPLFPSASDALQRQGLVRVIIREDTTAEVSVQAFDESVRDYDPLTLTVDDGRAVNIDSNDLETGNTMKGLSGSTGAGIGDWWLELASDSDIEVLSYISTPEGFFTSVHDAAPSVQNRHRVVTFNPGRNFAQVSRLRMINAGAEAARVKIRGVDDEGQSAVEVVRTTVPGHSARTFTAMDLESGAVELEGALGTGVGMWRLTVESDRPIAVMSLLDSPTTGRLTNLSTVPQGRARSRMLEEGGGAGGIVQTTYSVNDLLPGVPSSGVFTPTIHGGGSILITGNDTTISLDDGAYFELDDGTRYTCTAGEGCTIANGAVTAGTVVGRAAGAGEVDRFPTFRTATAPGDQSYTVGEAIESLTLPEASGGNGERTYGLSPEVPGLGFNAATRQLTGTPSAAGNYAMTYTVTDEDGDTDTLRFTITVSGGSSTEGSLGICQVGLTLRSGQSCTYPGTTDEFSVNARGRGSFLGRLAGIRIRIDNETINGRVYDFLASHRGEGVWRIDRVAGSTQPPDGESEHGL
ncbi:MAG: putative Ig domain-containing protein, partial [Rhodospirillaceae bacterium]|nr:putative Ig domain-containing protein [Rhodospirillaceae bacterium]